MGTISLCKKCAKPLPANAPEGLCPDCLVRVALGTEPAQPGSRVPPDIAQLAPQFPQLEILQFIGMGGMGMVYQARQRNLDRLVALKILPAAADQQTAFADRFAREARALARLNHPGIVDIYDFGQTPGCFYFVMEFVDGMNLRELINSGTVTPRQALEIVVQICQALQCAHDEGIVHRDIKPENILINKKGQVKIADFGLAKLLGATPDTALTMSQAAMGTLNYMAPEQRADAQKVDHRADIYSLGVVFYEMLTGEVPLGRFEAPSKRAVVDVRLDEVVLRALEREPERRYQHVSDVKNRVENITSTMPEGSPAPPAPGAVPTFGPKLPPGIVRFVGTNFAVLALAWLIIALLFRWIFSQWPALQQLGVYNPQTASLARVFGAIALGAVVLPFTFDVGRFLFPLYFLLVVYAWFEAREKKGLKLRQLPLALRRKLLSRAAGVGVIYAVLALGTFFSPLARSGALPVHQNMTHEWWYTPEGGAYEKLGLRATFSSFDRDGSTFYEAPPTCVVTLAVYRRNETNHPTIDITLPSLRCAYRIPLTNAWSYTPVLDKDTLIDWLQRGAGLDPAGSNFQKQASEIYTLMRRYENQAPHTSDELHNAADKDLSDFGVGGFTEYGNFSAEEPGGGIFWSALFTALGLETLAYLTISVVITRRVYAVAWSDIAAGRWSPPEVPPRFAAVKRIFARK